LRQQACIEEEEEKKEKLLILHLTTLRKKKKKEKVCCHTHINIRATMMCGQTTVLVIMFATFLQSSCRCFFANQIHIHTHTEKLVTS